MLIRRAGGLGITPSESDWFPDIVKAASWVEANVSAPIYSFVMYGSIPTPQAGGLSPTAPQTQPQMTQPRERTPDDAKVDIQAYSDNLRNQIADAEAAGTYTPYAYDFNFGGVDWSDWKLWAAGGVVALIVIGGRR